MIELTKYTDKYEQGLKRLLLANNMTLDQVRLCLVNTYVVADKDVVLGFGYYNMYDQEIYLDHLFVDPKERLNYLGDSLFRAILNALLMQGVKEVFMRPGQGYDVFLQHENIDLIEDRYVIDLYEFFNRKCRGKKHVETPLH